jgi:hypothetical protein
MKPNRDHLERSEHELDNIVVVTPSSKHIVYLVVFTVFFRARQGQLANVKLAIGITVVLPHLPA